MAAKKDTDAIIRKAIKLGVREDHAKSAITKNTSDAEVVAYSNFVEALEENADIHFSKR